MVPRKSLWFFLECEWCLFGLESSKFFLPLSSPQAAKKFPLTLEHLSSLLAVWRSLLFNLTEHSLEKKNNFSFCGFSKWNIGGCQTHINVETRVFNFFPSFFLSSPFSRTLSCFHCFLPTGDHWEIFQKYNPTSSWSQTLP